MKKVLFSCLVILFCFSIVLITGCDSDTSNEILTLRLINDTDSVISEVGILDGDGLFAGWIRPYDWRRISPNSEVTLTYDTINNKRWQPTVLYIQFEQFYDELIVENVYLVPGKTTTLTIHDDAVTYTLVNP